MFHHLLVSLLNTHHSFANWEAIRKWSLAHFPHNSQLQHWHPSEWKKLYSTWKFLYGVNPGGPNNPGVNPGGPNRP